MHIHTHIYYIPDQQFCPYPFVVKKQRKQENDKIRSLEPTRLFISLTRIHSFSMQWGYKLIGEFEFRPHVLPKVDTHSLGLIVTF